MLNKAIKDIDESLFNNVRAKCGGSKSGMENAIIVVLNDWARPKIKINREIKMDEQKYQKCNNCKRVGLEKNGSWIDGKWYGPNCRMRIWLSKENRTNS